MNIKKYWGNSDYLNLFWIIYFLRNINIGLDIFFVGKYLFLIFLFSSVLFVCFYVYMRILVNEEKYLNFFCDVYLL